MVRHYKRKPAARRYRDYTPGDLVKCLEEIRNSSISKAAAARKYNFSLRLIFHRLSKETLQISSNVSTSSSNGTNSDTSSPSISTLILEPGGQPVFSFEEEQIFCNHVVAASDFGFPLSSLDLRMIAKRYLEKIGRTVTKFKDGVLPGQDWALSFRQRHSELSNRFAKNISTDRASITEDDIRSYITNLTNTVEGVPPDCIYNYDETNLSDDPGSKKVLVRRGVKYPELLRNLSKTCISLMMCGNAAGEQLPTYVVYKSSQLWGTWTTGGPPGTRYNCSISGWFDEHLFEDWFKNSFLHYTKYKVGPKVIIGDNLSSHFSDEVLRLCRENNIRFVCLPPNSTHLTQPLDISYFAPMKRAWRRILGDWRITASGQRFKIIPKQEFPRLLKLLMNQLLTNSGDNLRSGFAKCSIYPINVDKIIERIPGRAYNKAVIEESFKEFLVEMREKAVGNTGLRRRKKRNVEPGKSLTAESEGEMNNEDEFHIDELQVPAESSVAMNASADVSEEGPIAPIATQKRGRKQKIQSKTAGNDMRKDVVSPSNVRTDVAGPSNVYPSKENSNRVDLKQLRAGIFVVVQYKFDNKRDICNKSLCRKYVGEVDTVFVNKLYIRFMRPYLGQISVFQFPDIEDYDYVKKQQVVSILDKPFIRRGIHTFNKPCF